MGKYGRFLPKYFTALFMAFTAFFFVMGAYHLAQDVNRPFGGYFTFYNAISDHNQFAGFSPSWWSGFWPGHLQKSDRPYRIDEQPYSTAAEIAAFANALAAGRPTIKIVVNRNEAPTTVELPVILFTWQHYFDIQIPNTLITVGLFLVAIVVYAARPDDLLNQVLAIICCIFVPTFTKPTLFHHDGPLSIWADAVFHDYRAFWGVLFFHFALLFPRQIYNRLAYYLLYFWYGLAFVVAFIPLSSIVPISSVTADVYTSQFTSRTILAGVICVFARIIYILGAYRQVSSLYRRQAVTFLIGILLATPAWIPFLLNEIWGRGLPYFFQYLDFRYIFLFIPATLASLILRYRSFQTKSQPLLLVPMLALSGLTANIVTFAVLRQPSERTETAVSTLFTAVFLALFLSSLLWSTQSSWQGWFGRLLHRQRQSYEGVRHFGQTILQQPDLMDLPQAMVGVACSELALECASVWLWQSEQNSFHLVAEAGDWHKPPPRILSVDFSQSVVTTAPIRHHSQIAQLPVWLQSLQLYDEIAIIVPLVVAEIPVGLLALGRRWDETIFDEQDLEVIELIGQQAALFLLTAVQVETLRAVPQAIAEAQERERQRIAQDLHDTVQQFLGRLPLFLQASRDLPEEADAILRRCIADIEDAARTLRRIRSSLEPVALDQGLRQGVIYLVDRFRLDNQIETSLELPHNLDTILPQQTWQHIYRIIGEALNNIAEHAQATQVQVVLLPQESGVSFSVIDNGIGSSLEQRTAARHQGHRGLQFMGNRLQAIGGTLAIESEPGCGMQVRGFIPFQYGLLA